jgi:hypothetical protein
LNLGSERGDAGGVSEIGSDGMDVSAILRAHLLGGPGHTVGIAVDEQHARAIRVKLLGNCAPDTASRPVTSATFPANV